MDANQIYKNLGQRIRGLRRRLSQTQDQLAKQVGISRASLANIEAGRQQVLVHHLFAFARALQVDSPAQLLLEETPRSRRVSNADSLPLSSKGLTKSQRHEILNLMGSVLISSHDNSDGDTDERKANK